ncbi:MAG: UDP-N-acetylmuramate--L-alanine ligase, partial [Candidatus Methylomirabilis sp.]|nr:UDP-N-acetylmuramate--L-alanine ligase [Deltaproteobacteria bacterium]
IARVLARFQGVQRRFQILGTFGGVTVVDDYAHNPSKVKAAIHAARTGGARRVIAVFQPHRYTRTKFLAHEFEGAFEEADVLLVTDIYAAGEPPIVGVKADIILDGVRRHGAPTRVHHTPGHREVCEFLVQECEPGDVVIALGAGDIGQCARSLESYLGNPALKRAAI